MPVPWWRKAGPVPPSVAVASTVTAGWPAPSGASPPRELDGPGQFAADIAAHEAEPTDARWARQMEKTLQDALERRLPANVPAELDGVDCRTTTCLVTLKFHDYAAARSSWQRVLATNYFVPCGVAVNAEPPSGPDDVYRLPVLFECTDSRASE